MNKGNLFETLIRISEEINSVHETDVLFDRIMDIAMEALDAERGFILLKRFDSGKEFEVVSARNISKNSIASIQELSSSVVNEALRQGKSILSLDAQSDERFAGADSIMMQKIRSVACAPLIRGEQVIGAIYVDSRAGSGKFDESSIQFLEAFSKQAAIAIENARLLETLTQENLQLKKQIAVEQLFPEMIGKSAEMVKIYEMIRTVADTDATVLIEGESGTGKELVARALHSHSSRKDKPFIPIFCGSLAENLLESELFGHRKGAFTGATENKAGLFEEADGGTIFLDEIADISMNIQTKLLRVLQEGEIKRVGDSRFKKVNVRVIAATNKNLWEEVQAGRFREDLYYRLNVINIKLPPLRERREDIPLLAQHFLEKFNRKNRKNIKGFSPAAMKALLDYHWPGNIRELENTIERAVILTREGEIQPEVLNLHREPTEILEGKTLKEIEKLVVLRTLEKYNFNRTRTAEALGVSRRWLQYQLKEWGISSEN